MDYSYCVTTVTAPADPKVDDIERLINEHSIMIMGKNVWVVKIDSKERGDLIQSYVFTKRQAKKLSWAISAFVRQAIRVCVISVRKGGMLTVRNDFDD